MRVCEFCQTASRTLDAVKAPAVRPLLPDLTAEAVLSRAEAQFRQHALVAVLAIALVTSVITWSIAFTVDFETRDKIGLTVVSLKNALLLAWLTRAPRAFVMIGTVHFLLLAGTAIVKFSQAVLAEHLAFGLGAYSYWLPMTYVVAFIVFRGRTALVASLGVLLACLLVFVVFWTSPAIPHALKEQNLYLFVQVYLTHVTFIAVLSFLMVLLARFLGAIRAAENEAKFAYADDLTGLPNRRSLKAQLRAQLERAAVTGQPLSVILFDLDHFKRVNDTHGHDAGDDVLRGTGHAVQGVLRRGTLFGRWGGEEFLIVLPHTDADEATMIAERVRAAIGAATYLHAGRVTASCGVAQAQPSEALEHLLARADAASYDAKHAGRDCVRTAA